MSKTFAKATSYPLSWPDGFPKTKRQESSRFNTTLAKALDNVYDAIKKFSNDSGKQVGDLIISSNYSLTEQKPKEAGVVIYFTWDGEETCIPVDKYTLVEDNLQAIFHCIEAKRTMLRHGGINLVKAAFRGYAALPHKTEIASSFEELFGVSIERFRVLDDRSKSEIYQKARSKHHPDRGGDAENFNTVQKLWEQERPK